jgi:hypothetical protein
MNSRTILGILLILAGLLLAIFYVPAKQALAGSMGLGVITAATFLVLVIVALLVVGGITLSRRRF